ncbi:LysR family transcriptional regulator [Massilia sp. WF1]|uniref:LysR family transcriptional regulator n=1 Tax=unclassified Massilia TaxID=2609279 RepID=UPI0006492997|nr:MULTISPECIES: LysR family transcriptional regulator [unclassified Massilia]ALK96764.1 LysR family transcriptional regulator [Massilia sp. WG5]KLU38107.1 LysR family transcriptional regulator [Massilia sp. WF1]
MKESGDLRFLLVLREHSSLLAAARSLGLTPSAVSQRLQQIERGLDVHLVDRSSRKLRFTEEGELLCNQGVGVIEQFDTLLEEVRSRRGGMAGTLKINAPLGFGRRYIAAAAAEYQQLHPEVDVVLTLSDQPLTEIGDRFDVGIHIGELALSNLIAYKIAPNSRLVCAAPALLRRVGIPDEPEQLAHLPCLALRENNEDGTLWHFRRGRVARSVRIQPKLVCNDGDVVHQWAREGRGIIVRSEWDVAADIASGSLVRLLPAFKLSDANVIALTHARKGLPLRTRSFMKFLQERFQPLPPWRSA